MMIGGDKPQLYLIAGPNGAGKTSFARQFLPAVGVMEFLNADALAAGLSPLKPELKALAAGRLLLNRWRELMGAGESFAVETTLSGKTYVKLIEECRRRGYEVRLFYLTLPNVQTSVRRVSQRVVEGGHDIPPEDLSRRFIPSLRNFFELYLPLADEAALYDSTQSPPRLIASWEDGVVNILFRTDYENIQRRKDAEEA